MKNLREWLKSGKYLPEIMQDFHDCKAVFKAMHQLINVEKHNYAGKVDWVTGQCYVVDIFLWFMAMRGYTLQKTRTKCEFYDLENDLEKLAAARDKAFARVIEEALDAQPGVSNDHPAR